MHLSYFVILQTDQYTFAILKKLDWRGYDISARVLKLGVQGLLFCSVPQSNKLHTFSDNLF